MKITLLTTEFPPDLGGVANYYGALRDYWPEPQEFLVEKTDHNSGWKKYCGYFMTIAKEKDSDYFLAGQILPLGTALWLASFFHHLRYGVFLHGLDFSLARRSAGKRFLSRRILRRAKIIIAANSRVADDCRLFLSEKQAKKVVVICPGAKAPGHIESITRDDLRDKKILLSIGRLVPRKGFDYTIKALELLPPNLKNTLVYAIIGSGEQELVLKKLAENNPNIIFLGSLPEAEKWSWLNLCDLFIMPARDIAGDYEGFGIVYLEANLMSKPVLAGNSGGVSDAVVDGVNGIMVDSENIDAISEGIVKLMNNDDWRKKLGEQGRERAIKDFSPAALAKKLYQHLNSL